MPRPRSPTKQGPARAGAAQRPGARERPLRAAPRGAAARPGGGRMPCGSVAGRGSRCSRQGGSERAAPLERCRRSQTRGRRCRPRAATGHPQLHRCRGEKRDPLPTSSHQLPPLQAACLASTVFRDKRPRRSPRVLRGTGEEGTTLQKATNPKP